MVHTRPPSGFDPYQAPPPQPETAMTMEHSKVADIAAGSAWGFFGLSMTQLNELLQAIALVLTIIATTITIGIHVRRWFKRLGID